jgi:hypothetical protein
MTESNRQKLMVALREHLDESVESIQEDYSETFLSPGYRIQLKEGVDKDEIVREILAFVDGRIDFEDSFDLWVNGFGEDFETQATKVPIYQDVDYAAQLRPVDVLPFKQFGIEVNGSALTVHPQQDGTFVIWNGKEKLGAVFPESTGEVIVWSSGEMISKEWTDAIGKAIERNTQSESGNT